MRKVTKKAQLNFTWIFAILAGGAILLLAIYGATRVGDTARFQSDSEIAKQISILADPLQAGYAEGSFGSISFQKETRVNNICYSTEFGKNEISVSTRSSVGEEWNPAGVATTIKNKYIFSKTRTSGKDFYIFSKPFKLPYKVADLIFMTSENYCFSGSGTNYQEIVDEVTNLNIPNIETTSPCVNTDAIKVCFSSTSNCDIIVSGDCSGCDSDFDKGTVKWTDSGETVAYVGNLMYAAIFSEGSNYNCNIERLLYRAEKISEELINKSNLMSARDCSTGMNSDLSSWKTRLSSATPENIQLLLDQSNNLEIKNDGAYCNLW
jgi:hypothetical protein